MELLYLLPSRIRAFSPVSVLKVDITVINYTLMFISFVSNKSINQPDATVSQVYYLKFTRMYSSTCFGRPHAHHQEISNYSSSLWFYRWSVVVGVLLFVVGPVVELLMMMGDTTLDLEATDDTTRSGNILQGLKMNTNA